MHARLDVLVRTGSLICPTGYYSAIDERGEASITEVRLGRAEAGCVEEQRGRTESCDQREEKRSSDRTLNSSLSASGVWKGIAERPL